MKTPRFGLLRVGVANGVDCRGSWEAAEAPPPPVIWRLRDGDDGAEAPSPPDALRLRVDDDGVALDDDDGVALGLASGAGEQRAVGDAAAAAAAAAADAAAAAATSAARRLRLLPLRKGRGSSVGEMRRFVVWIPRSVAGRRAPPC